MPSPLTAGQATRKNSFLASFTAIAVTALVVSLIYYQHTLMIITASGERAGLTITHTFLNSLDSRLLDFLRQAGYQAEKIYSSTDWTELDRTVRHVMGQSGVAKIKIYNKSGMTIYSTEVRQVGEDQHANQGFQQALEGKITSSLVSRNTFNSMDGVIEDKDLIQTYAPVTLQTGHAGDMGVFELYTDVSLLVQRLKATRYQVVSIIVVALLLLYMTHLWITRRAQLIIVDQGVTIRQKSRALEYSESLANSLFDSIHEKIMLASMDGRVLRVNRFARQNCPENPEGRKLVELFGDKVSEQELSNAMQAIELTLATSVPHKGVLTMDWQDKSRTLSLDTYPVVDARGRAHQIILYLRDITDERKQQMQACRQEKLIGLGALAAGYAHDLVNPIAALSSELELLEHDAPAHEIRKSLDTQRELLQRLSGIVTRMRDSFRATRVEVSTTSVAEAMKTTLQWVRYEAATHGVTIETHCQEPIPAAPIAPNHLVMVLCNLVTNAIQATQAGGAIFIYAAELENGELQIEVQDSGSGMAAEDIHKSLSALYTTKPEGLGLGLTVSHELIRAAGGQLSMVSELGRGTTVRILFPRCTHAVRPQDEYADMSGASGS
jgi:signal transduction histidine kinase